MAKGKYANKAANRLAQIDSEIVDQLKGRIASLEQDLAQTQREKREIERDTHRRAQALAQEMSHGDVEAMQRRLAEGERAATARMREAAEELFDFLSSIDKFPADSPSFTKIIAKLKVGNFNEMFEESAARHGVDFGWGRDVRRRSTKTTAMIDEYHNQHGRDRSKAALKEQMAAKLAGADE